MFPISLKKAIAIAIIGSFLEACLIAGMVHLLSWYRYQPVIDQCLKTATETVEAHCDCVKKCVDRVRPENASYTPFEPLCDLDNVSCPERALRRTVTAYNSVPGQTDDSPCIAADGTNICRRYSGGEGICASNELPFGSLVWIEGYGLCTVADRMNQRYSDRIDVFFGYDVTRAKNWGRRKVEVEVFSKAS